ncbi:MAG: 30S ribosomal protein S2 [Bacteroidota bacterium]|nr:30S ribosomal protein S2 [Bacteroidota bacterium]
MSRTNFDELLKAGVHFGHLKRKWNPKMAPFIFMERGGIHILDLNKTIVKLDEASEAIKNIAKSGKQILFVATKKQAKELVEEKIEPTGMPYITERWTGGMLTNFRTVKRAINKMKEIDSMATDGTFEKISKRERLQITREKAKLEKNLGSIAHMKRLPSAIFVVDVFKEKIAVREAQKLDIPVFGMVDTNSSPDIDFPIPSNDDASKSIDLITDVIVGALNEGIQERKAHDKDKKQEKAKVASKSKSRARKSSDNKDKQQ